MVQTLVHAKNFLLRVPNVAWVDPRVPWRMLRYFNLYRLALSGLLLMVSVGGSPPEPFGMYDPGLFASVSALYLVCALLSQAALESRVGTLNRQVIAHVSLDSLCLCALMYASGGVASGFGILLVISVGGASLVCAGLTALWLAAQTSLMLLATTLLSIRFQFAPLPELSQAGLIGVFLFTVAAGGYALAERARRSEALAARRAQDIATLSELNESIVQRMRSGVMVVDDAGRVSLANDAAIRLAHLPVDALGQRTHLNLAARPALNRAWARWLSTGVQPVQPVEIDSAAPASLVSFTRLGALDEGRVVIFLEDAAEAFQRAQQLKLMSLGRLTASIAHEVRNPLGAISHAAQLLDESEALPAGDRRLVAIIHQHSARVNEIIENVMQLGRRESALNESFDLCAWLLLFAAEYRELHGLAADALVVECLAGAGLGRDGAFDLGTDVRSEAALTNEGTAAGKVVTQRKSVGQPLDVRQAQEKSTANMAGSETLAAKQQATIDVRMDTSQLRQVLVNLCDNALRYATGTPKVRLRAEVQRASGRPMLSVIDTGPGMEDRVARQVFEPFFSAAAGGTGLGLYIARELCQNNQATLSLVAHGVRGCEFRILFAHPERQQVKVEDA